MGICEAYQDNPILGRSNPTAASNLIKVSLPNNIGNTVDSHVKSEANTNGLVPYTGAQVASQRADL